MSLGGSIDINDTGLLLALCGSGKGQPMKHDESNQVWAVVRLAAEVSDWKRDSETLVQWAERTLNAARSESRSQEPSEAQKTAIREAVTLFIATITGFRPPHEREAFPPEVWAAMDMLTMKIWKELRQ